MCVCFHDNRVTDSSEKQNVLKQFIGSHTLTLSAVSALSSVVPSRGVQLLNGVHGDGHRPLFLFVRQSSHRVVVKQDGRGFIRRLPHAVHAPPVLLQVTVAIEAGGAEVTGKRALPGVDDDMSGELRAALLVLAADVADEALRRPRSVVMDDLPVPLQVAEAPEAAAAEVAAERAHVAVDEGVAGQQGPEPERFAADGAGEHLGGGGGGPAAPSGGSVTGLDLQVNPDVVLLETGGALEAAQTDAAAVRLVARVDAGVSGEERL